MKQLGYIALVLLFFSCEKAEIPQVNESQAEFYLKGELNGELFQIEAGEDDYYMSTQGYSDEKYVYYQGKMQRVNCIKILCANFILNTRITI